MKPFLLTILVACAVWTNAQSLSEKNYLIYSVAKAKTISLAELIDEAAAADVLFFGEEHNDSVAHYLEFEVTKAMHQRHGQNFAVAMEMFERDVQDVMNEYLQGFIREKHFKKDARVWSNYTDYRPIVEYAREQGIHVVCSNAASRYTNLAGREGQDALKRLPKESLAHFAPLPYDTASGGYYDKLMALMGHGPAPAAPTTPTQPDSAKAAAPAPPVSNPMGGFNLVMGQSLWDATMAYSTAQYLKKNKKHKVLHVNGRFHSDEHYGIVIQLKKYSPKTKSMVISCTSDENFPNINWSDHTANGDFIIITDPAVPKTYDE